MQGRILKYEFYLNLYELNISTSQKEKSKQKVRKEMVAHLTTNKFVIQTCSVMLILEQIALLTCEQTCDWGGQSV